MLPPGMRACAAHRDHAAEQERKLLPIVPSAGKAGGWRQVSLAASRMDPNEALDAQVPQHGRTSQKLKRTRERERAHGG